MVINRYGVFIIEVKNYKGELVGNGDDYEWKKYKTTGAGNTYEKTVKNPIRQVKRQIHMPNCYCIGESEFQRFNDIFKCLAYGKLRAIDTSANH